MNAEKKQFRQINIQVPNEASETLKKVGAMLRTDPDFVDALAALIDKPASKYLALRDVQTRIKAAKVEAKKIDAESGLGLEYANAETREALRLAAVADFIKAGMLVAEGLPGRFIINSKFEMAPLSRKWRVLGKAKWYRYKDAADFKARFIDKS